MPESDRETPIMRVLARMFASCKQIQTISASPPSSNLTVTVRFRGLPSTKLSSTGTKTVEVQACIRLSMICDKHYGIFRETYIIKELILCMVYHVKFLIKFIRLWTNICSILVLQYEPNHDNCFHIKVYRKRKLFSLNIS